MKLLVASAIAPEAIETLRLRHDLVCAFGAGETRLCEAIRDREVVVFRSGVQLTAEVMASACQLKLLVRAGCGLDNVDLDYVREKQLQLERIPGPGVQAVAEMAFALMLNLGRHILQADQLLRQGRWAKNELSGLLLHGKRLGIVGAGSIGSRVGQLGAAWGMDVAGCVAAPLAHKASSLDEKGIRLTTFDEVVASSDFLSIHAPLNDSTHRLINAEVLARMKPGALLVNLARGGVVDEAALRDALTRPGGLAGAALDVHQHEGEGKVSVLAGLPNVVLTPHIGASTVDSQRQIGQQIVKLIDGFASKKVSPLGHLEAVV